MKNATTSKKDRILQTACGLFSEQGFTNTTVANICEAAEVNIAAINYYFGGKQALYMEVWRYAFSVAKARFPIELNDSSASVEEALFVFSRAVLQRVFCEDEGGCFTKLLYQEMAAPTLALDQILTEALEPQSRYLQAVIRRFCAKAATDENIRSVLYSIIGQCAFYNFSRPLRERVMGKNVVSDKEVERIARHIARFSVGGLKEIYS